MADARDSKSLEGNFMWVRLPPPAPQAQGLGVQPCSGRFLLVNFASWQLFFCDKTIRSRTHWVRRGTRKIVQIFWVGLPPPAPQAQGLGVQPRSGRFLLLNFASWQLFFCDKTIRSRTHNQRRLFL